MKIIQLIQKPQLRGAEIFACQLSNHLVKQGHQVIVVSIFNGDSRLPFSGEVIHLDRPLSKRFYDIKGWRQFRNIIKKFQPDIVQANAADTLKFASSSKILFSWKEPLVYRNANKMGDFIDSGLKWKLNNFYLSKVAYVISVSRECERDFIETFRFSKNRIETVEIGVENIKLGPIPIDLQDVFDRGPVVTHIGGFVPEKNHQGLINIFFNTLKAFPNAQLLLMGKGKLESQVQEQVKKLAISDNVHFLGYRNDVLDILTHSRAFVLPSFIEGLPAVILEAMFCETPVIAYDVGGIKEVVIPDHTGCLIEKNDESTFADKLEHTLSYSKDTQSRIENAKEMINTKFINSKITERFFKVYRKVLS